jgi:hypothetical protein
MQATKRHPGDVNGGFTIEDPLLFLLPESPSPRLAWYRTHRIRVGEGKCGGIEALGSFARKTVPGFVAMSAHGRDEDEAVTKLAKKAGVPLWFEEEFASRGGLEA